MDNLAKPQFTLRAIMITMAVVCFLCAFFFAFPIWLQYLTVRALSVAVTAVVAALVIYGRDSLRAFGVGASIPLLSGFLGGFLGGNQRQVFEQMVYDGMDGLVTFVVYIVSIALSGGVCVVARRWIISRPAPATSVEPPPMSQESRRSAPPVHEKQSQND